MTTSCPSLARSAATVNPAGPAPTTATFLPVDCGFSVTLTPLSLSQSATHLSNLPTLMGSPIFPKMHFCWHCSSCGQTRPQIAGRAFFSLIFFAASSYFPSLRSLMNSGIGTPTGQPDTHCGFGHCRQRLASSQACSSV